MLAVGVSVLGRAKRGAGVCSELGDQCDGAYKSHSFILRPTNSFFAAPASDPTARLALPAPPPHGASGGSATNLGMA